MKLKGGQTRAQVWHQLQPGDAECCMCAKGLKKVGYLWRAVLWWCDDCFSRNSSNVMTSGILLDGAQDLPLQYTAEDTDDLHDALLLWTAPKHIQRWDDPEESRQGRYYDLHLSIWQMSNGQRRHVAKVRNNSLMLRVSALPPANHGPLAEGTTDTPGTTAFALMLSGARYLQVWKDVFPFLYKVDKEDQKAQKGAPPVTSENADSPGLTGSDNIATTPTPGKNLEPPVPYPLGDEELPDLPLPHLDLASLEQLLEPAVAEGPQPRSASSGPGPASTGDAQTPQPAAQETGQRQAVGPWPKSRGKQLWRISRVVEEPEPEELTPEEQESEEQEDLEGLVGLEDGELDEQISVRPQGVGVEKS